VGLKLNGSHQLLAYADYVNLSGNKLRTITKNTKFVIDASNEVGLEVSTEKAKYMLMSCHQNAGENWDIKIANKSFEE
jgi:hypothetical protein